MNAYESVAKIVEKVENIYWFIHSPLTVEAFFHFSSFPMSRNRARRKKNCENRADVWEKWTSWDGDKAARRVTIQVLTDLLRLSWKQHKAKSSPSAMKNSENYLMM